MVEISFNHKLAAHCESGTVTRLLNHAGIELSEAMVFGISGSIFFGYFNTPMIPFPTIAVRNQPGKIRSNLAKYLGIRFQLSRFRDPERASRKLDVLLDRRTPVAVQVDFFYMDYIPAYARAHFNGHFIVVMDKNTHNYIISDAYSPQLVELDKETLQTARFAKGSFAPKGLMFHLPKVREDVNLEKAIRKGIKHAAFYMLRVPIPFLGVRGIRYFARKLLDWPKYARDTEHLSDEVMMLNVLLEERGTGGGGFRFLYATFLREASEVMSEPALAEIAGRMMENGDQWRMISFFAAKMGRKRDLGRERLTELSEMILKRANVEKRLFADLMKIVK